MKAHRGHELHHRKINEEADWQVDISFTLPSIWGPPGCNPIKEVGRDEGSEGFHLDEVWASIPTR